MAKVVSDDRARQGGPGRPVLYVLIASLALVAIYLVSLLGWSGATSPPTNQPQATSQPSGTAPGSTAGAPSANPAPSSPSQTGSTGTPAPR